MKRTSTLAMLEAYASRITKGQAAKLYEAKCNRKYVKVLNESQVAPTKFDLYIDQYNIMEAGYEPEDVASAIEVRFGAAVSIDMEDTGIMACTDADTYGDLWEYVSDELMIEVSPSHEWQTLDDERL